MKDSELSKTLSDSEIENQSFKQIRAGAIVSYIAVFINLLLGIIYTPWVLGVLGEGDYGLYGLSSALVAMFAIDFGLSTGVSRFVSKYRAEHDLESTNNFLGVIYKLYFGVTFIILIVLTVLFFFLDSMYASFTTEELEKFKVIYIITSIITLINIPFITLNGILNAYEQFFVLKLCNLVQKLVNVSLSIVALLMGMGVFAYVVINGVSLVLVIIIKLILIKRKTPVKVNFRCKSRGMIGNIFSFSLWSTCANLAQRFVFNIIPAVLGMVSNTVAITHFSLASNMEGYVFTFSDALNGLFLPKVSRIVARERSSITGEGVLHLMIKVGRINLSIVGILITGFIVVGKDFVKCWVGDQYMIVYYATIAMILPSIISNPQQIANTTVLARNKVKLQAIIMGSASVINIILSYNLSKSLGAMGAALSICIIYFIRIFCMNIVYYRVLNINIFKFFKECHLKIMPVMIIAGIIGVAVMYFIKIPGWLGLMCEGAIFAIIYVLLFWFFSWNEFEKELIKTNTLGILKKNKIKK